MATWWRASSPPTYARNPPALNAVSSRKLLMMPSSPPPKKTQELSNDAAAGDVLAAAICARRPSSRCAAAAAPCCRAPPHPEVHPTHRSTPSTCRAAVARNVPRNRKSCRSRHVTRAGCDRRSARTPFEKPVGDTGGPLKPHEDDDHVQRGEAREPHTRRTTHALLIRDFVLLPEWIRTHTHTNLFFCLGGGRMQRGEWIEARRAAEAH